MARSVDEISLDIRRERKVLREQRPRRQIGLPRAPPGQSSMTTTFRTILPPT
jgi:hypothetical protein